MISRDLIRLIQILLLAFCGMTTATPAAQVTFIYKSENAIPFVWKKNSNEFFIAEYDEKKDVYNFCQYSAENYEQIKCPFLVKGMYPNAKIYSIDLDGTQVLFGYGIESENTIGSFDYSNLKYGETKKMSESTKFLENTGSASHPVWYGEGEVLFEREFYEGIELAGFKLKYAKPQRLISNAGSSALTKEKIWYSAYSGSGSFLDAVTQGSLNSKKLFGISIRERVSGKIEKMLEGVMSNMLTVSDDDRYAIFEVNHVANDSAKFKAGAIYGFDKSENRYCFFDDVTKKSSKTSAIVTLENMKISPTGNILLYEVSNNKLRMLFALKIDWKEDCREVVKKN